MIGITMYIFVKGDISSRKHKPYFFFRNRISCAADCNACGIIPQYTAVCGFYFGIYAVFGQFIAGCIVALITGLGVKTFTSL